MIEFEAKRILLFGSNVTDIHECYYVEIITICCDKYYWDICQNKNFLIFALVSHVLINFFFFNFHSWLMWNRCVITGSWSLMVLGRYNLFRVVDNSYPLKIYKNNTHTGFFD